MTQRFTSVSPTVALVVAILGVSSSAILVRWSGASSTVIAFYRVLFTLAAVAPIAVHHHREAFSRISGRDWVAAVAAGIALAIHFVAFFESLSLTTIAASVTLVQTQPLFVAIGAVLLLDERVDRRVVAGIAIALVGAVIMSLAEPGAALPTGGDATLGNLLAIGGGVMAACYLLAGRSLRQRVPIFPYVTVVYAACVGTLFPVVLLSDAPVVAYPPREWLLFLAMAAGPGLMGHTVLNWALEHVQSTVVSVSLLGEPVGATLLGIVLLAEVPTEVTVVGGLVVLGGIYVTATSGTTRRVQDGAEEEVEEQSSVGVAEDPDG